MLHLMMRKGHGCDVEILPRELVLEFGAHRGKEYYVPEDGPAIVSWFLENAPAGYLPAGTLPYWSGMRGHWSYDPWSVWIDVTNDCIMIMIRDASHRDGLDPSPLPAPPPLRPPTEFVAGTHSCPHCGEVPKSYRKLRDGSLVCMACGAST